jgi:hypothetical protein
LPALGLDAAARFEIDFRLAPKEDEFQQALVQAQGIRVDVLADDGLVFGGQPIKTTTVIANRGAAPVQVKSVTLTGFDGEAGCKTGEIRPATGVFRCESNLRVPPGATVSTPYWHPLPNAARYEFDKDAPFGLPFRPTPFRARLDLSIDGADVTIDTPVQYRYEGTIFTGEKRMELLVVPRYSVSLTPDIAIIPSAAVKAAAAPAKGKAGRRAVAASDRELRVTVVNGNKGPSSADVSLQVPTGWSARPATASTIRCPVSCATRPTAAPARN